jgi:surface polysaccharide O-acyltransferase-like enzyme
MSVISIAWLFMSAIRQNLTNIKLNSFFGGLPAALLILFLIRSFSIDAFDINPWNSVIWIILGSMIGERQVEKQGQNTLSLTEGNKL